jgi:hypothetical protein
MRRPNPESRRSNKGLVLKPVFGPQEHFQTLAFVFRLSFGDRSPEFGFSTQEAACF